MLTTGPALDRVRARDYSELGKERICLQAIRWFPNPL